MIKERYDYEEYDEESGNIYVKKDGMRGLISGDRKVILLCKYDKISFPVGNYNDGFGLVVEKDYKYGLYSMSGKEILPIEYDTILEELNKEIELRKKNTRGLYSINEGMLVPCNYCSWGYDFEGNQKAKLYKVTNIVDGEYTHGALYKNKEIVPCIYTHIKLKRIGEYTYIVGIGREVDVYNLNGDKEKLEDRYKHCEFSDVYVYNSKGIRLVYVEGFSFGLDTITNMIQRIKETHFIGCSESKKYLLDTLNEIKDKYN